jgi:phage RecT family recombinase
MSDTTTIQAEPPPPPPPPPPSHAKKDRSPRETALLFVRNQLNNANLRGILPPHIPAERFKRVVDTAIQNTPKILDATPRSIFNACMRAASDGLLPDGREGAIVPFKDWKASKEARRDIIDVQWMPMVSGILKKIRNSGQVAVITAKVVYAGDQYRYWIDDSGEHLIYEPSEAADRNIVRTVFAMARTKDGEVIVEPLLPVDIERIRKVSRAKDDGPWVDWWDEMAKKSAIRRLSKRLPMSTDLDDLIRRDDSLYDFESSREEGRIERNESFTPPPPPPPLAIGHEQETGEVGYDDKTETPNLPPPPPSPPAPSDAKGQAIPHDPATGEVIAPEGHPLSIPKELRRDMLQTWMPLTAESLTAWVTAQTDPHRIDGEWNDHIAPRLPIDGLSYEEANAIVQARIKALEP